MKYILIASLAISFSLRLYGADQNVAKTIESKNKSGALALKDIVYSFIISKKIKIKPIWIGLIDHSAFCTLCSNLTLENIPKGIAVPLDCTTKFIANGIAIKQHPSWEQRTTLKWTKFGLVTSAGKGFVKDRALLFDAMERNTQVAAYLEKIQKEHSED